jgi:hypothetical protein
MTAPSNSDVSPVWSSDPEWWSANRAEHAVVGHFELVAFDLPESDKHPRKIGWEVFTGPKLLDLVASGTAASFDEAQKQAETVWRGVPPDRHLPLGDRKRS